jgi:type II secretory pathway predicted ATPase ExeA
MYRELQALKRQPFQDTIDTEFFFSGGGRGEIVDEINSVLSQSVSLVLLTGVEGSGKTMVCRMVEKELHDGMISVFFPEAINSFADMVNTLLHEIGPGLDGDETGADAASVPAKIATMLQERNLRLVVFFDEAEKIYLATLERVRKLLDQVNGEQILFQFVLSGRTSLEENLEQLSMVSFGEVDERHFTLEPLDEDDSCNYLNHCMNVASGMDGTFFSQDLVSTVSRNGATFSRLNHFALESLQSDRLDTSFLGLLDTAAEKPVAAVTPRQETEQWESPKPPRKAEVNIEFLSLKKLLPGWILYGGGAFVIALLLFLWFGRSDDKEPIADVPAEVPIIELKRVVPEIQPAVEPVIVEQENESVPETVNEAVVPEPAVEPVIAEQENEPVPETVNEAVVPEPAVEPVIAEQENEPVPETVNEAVVPEPAVEPVIAEQENEPVPETVNEAVVPEPAVEPVIAEQENEPVSETVSEAVVPEVPAEAEADLSISIVDKPVEEKQQPVEKQPSPTPLNTQEPARSAVAAEKIKGEQEKRPENVAESGAESTTNVMVEPLEETEKPFSPDVVKETKLPDIPRLPEPIVVIDEEKKYKELPESEGAKTFDKVEEDPVADLTDKEVNALFLKRIAAGARWLVGGGSGKYTIQLMVLTSDQAEKSLKQMLRTADYQSVADQLYVLRRTGPDPTVMVFYGEYPNLPAARNSRNSLPVFLRKHHPYAISVFGAVEKATAAQ